MTRAEHSSEQIPVCPECDFKWSASASEVLATISGAPSGYRDLLDGQPAPAWHRRPQPNVWSPIEYLAHVVDAVDWYRERIMAVLSHRGVRLEPFDWDEACSQRRYSERNPIHTLNELERASVELGELLDGLDATSWRQAGVGSTDNGPRTVLTLGRRAAHEVRHHHRDIERQTGRGHNLTS